MYQSASLDVIEKAIFSIERQGGRNMHLFCLESYNRIVSDVFLHFSAELIMSRYINTQYEEKYLTFQRNILDIFKYHHTVLVVFRNRMFLVVS